MGKTYRNTKTKRSWFSNFSDQRDKWIAYDAQRDLIGFMKRGRTVKKTKDEFDAEYNAVLNSDEFKEAVKAYESQYRWYKTYLELWECRKAKEGEDFVFKHPRPSISTSKPEPWVSRTKRVEIENYDEIVEELFKESAKYYDSFRSRGRIRDGVMSNSERSSGFSHDCDKAKRISDRKNVNRIMKGDDPDNIVWYGRKDGKSKIWDWW